MSQDTLESHRSFAANHNLNFPLLADTEGKIGAAYGVASRGTYYERVTFVIGADGRIAKVFPSVNPQGHADEVLAVLRTLPGR